MMDGDDTAQAMNQEANRLHSFLSGQWPHGTDADGTGGLLTPANMARAGFYYAPRPGGQTGEGAVDRAVCFSCGGALKDWREGLDDPWEQHTEWFPDCRFVRDPAGKPSSPIPRAWGEIFGFRRNLWLVRDPSGKPSFPCPQTWDQVAAL
jgi:hypothetical protein